MIGLILAAGAGRRLRPYTDDLPKALVPVDGSRTVLDLTIANFAKVGLTDVAIIVGYKAERVEERRKDFEATYGVNVELVYNDKAEEWNNAYSLWCGRDLLSQDVVLANGDTVHAFIVKPADFDPKKKYPLAFLIHGGPQGSFSNDWHYRWNPQTYAGHGFVAVMVDFHGSTGYGQGFTDAIRDDWGGKPLEDLQKGLASALTKYPFIDKTKMCALGASYGGYMVNYIAGVWNEPWKCLVSHDGNLDERMAYFDTEELWFPEWEHRGAPWENAASYTKHNPIDHVGKWKVPMLVVHSAKDYRVVDTQGLSTFTALQRRNVPSKLLFFPDENHWVLKPANSVLWHETVLGWLDQWVQH